MRLLLLASQGQRFDRHVLVKNCLWLRSNLTHFVGQVTVHELLQTKLHHVLIDPLWCSIIDCVALGQENYTIEHLENFCAWLVNRGHDCLSAVGLFSHQLHKFDGGGGIKAGRGLVQNDQRRLRDHLVPNRCLFSFTVRNAALTPAANLRILAFLQAESAQDFLYNNINGFIVH